jgi:hypothetical protein
MPGSAHPSYHQAPRNVEQPTVLHPGWAGRFARTTGETTIQMRNGLIVNTIGFKQILDQVNSTPWAIKLIT